MEYICMENIIIMDIDKTESLEFRRKQECSGELLVSMVTNNSSVPTFLVIQNSFLKGKS